VGTIFNRITNPPTGQTILEKDISHSEYEHSEQLRKQPLPMSIDPDAWRKNNRNYTAPADETSSRAGNKAINYIADKLTPGF
jgi:hypothetical protein